MRTKKGIALPNDFAGVLQSRPLVQAVFERMRPSCQREYAEWIDAAKKAETRAKRIDHTLDKIAEWGKRHPQPDPLSISSL